jgi:hypothetical protein
MYQLKKSRANTITYTQRFSVELSTPEDKDFDARWGHDLVHKYISLLQALCKGIVLTMEDSVQREEW